LASVSSGIRAMWPNRQQCHAWAIAQRCGWLLGCPSHIISQHIPNRKLECWDYQSGGDRISMTS